MTTLHSTYEKINKQLEGFYHWRNHKKTFTIVKLSYCLQQTYSTVMFDTNGKKFRTDILSKQVLW